MKQREKNKKYQYITSPNINKFAFQNNFIR